MKVGFYFLYIPSELDLAPRDFIRTLTNTDAQICVPDWLGHKEFLTEFKNVIYMSPDDFFALEHFVVFTDMTGFTNALLLNKNVCFVIESFTDNIGFLISDTQKKVQMIKDEYSQRPHSIISLYYKELRAPFDTLLSQPKKTKYRNCYIISDALTSQLESYGFDKEQDIAIPYVARASHKPQTHEKHEGLLSPSHTHGSFRQALMAENIYFEPDLFDNFVISVALKQLAYTTKTYKTHNPTLKKLELFNS